MRHQLKERFCSPVKNEIKNKLQLEDATIMRQMQLENTSL